MQKDSLLSFLKWAGGKKRLVLMLDKLTPSSIDRYFEPFLGSGAFFFYLIQTRKEKFYATISDSNPELINTYQVIRDNVKELIEILREHQNNYYKKREKYYYHIRNNVISKNKTELAARFIFLNKTCYNGLYRVNKIGLFNVPHGRYLNPKICNEEKLTECSNILIDTGVEIICDSYKNVISKCESDDLIYLDPPYFPTSKTSNFTDYTKEHFGMLEHYELAKEFERLSLQGSRIILSNSNSDYIKSLYKNYNILKVKSLRNINCNPSKRKNHHDLIITNYNNKIKENVLLVSKIDKSTKPRPFNNNSNNS